MTTLIVAFVCASVTWTFTNGTVPDRDLDRMNAETADRGCKRYYGPEACLIKMTKYGARDYRAICRTRAP